MFLKALTIDPSDVACSAQPSAYAAMRAGQASDDALLDLAAELLIRRGRLTDTEAADLSTRVRKAQALTRWRGQPI